MGFESGAGEFMQAGSYSSAQMRRSVFGWAARTGANTPGLISGGLYSATDMQLTAAVSGLVVNTSVGECLIGGSEASNQGGYHGFLSSISSTTLAPANASNPRIDLICATVGDASYTLPSGGTSGQVTIQAVTGTPTAGATLVNLSGAPSLPLSSLLLGYVQVPATALNITGTNIANKATVVQPGLYIPGALLAKTIYAPSNTTYSPNTSSLTVVDATNLAVTFTAPSSGAVTVRLQGEASLSGSGYSAGQYQAWGIMSAGSQVGSWAIAYEPISASGAVGASVLLDFEVTALTAGAAYTFDWGAYAQTSNARISVGPGTFGNNPAATMKVYAA